MFDEGLKITQASNKEWIGKDFHFNKRKDTIVIGGTFFGGHHIPCKDIKEFKILATKSQVEFSPSIRFIPKHLVFNALVKKLPKL